MQQLTQHQEMRDLISIHRSEIDDNAIQGFVLSSSAELAVLQYVYDFTLDGLLVIRVADITEIECTTTDKFQKGLLEHEGVLEKVPFGGRFDLDSWRSVITQFSKEYALMILECEIAEEKDFHIGRVVNATATDVQFQNFSGAGNWDKNAADVKFADITSCQVATRYIDAYKRHFDRLRANTSNNRT